MVKETGEIRAVGRNFEIIGALRDLDGAGITEISAYTGLPNSTIHRHLSTLCSLGHVVKEDDVYHLGLSFLNYGEYVQNRKQVYRLAKNKVREVAEETDERCQFLVEEYGKAVYVHVSTGRRAVQTDSQVGERVYLHSTSIGWAILANLPEQRVNDIIDQWGLPKFTENTVTDREELFEGLAEVRETGVAFNKEENVEGLRSVGVPVMGADGEVVGALSVSAPTHRMKGKRYTEEIPNLLLGTANELELNLKYA
ncbi:IclR family transcriptional regulator [Haloferax sp. DFSO52]|uniref:IclR family transcriptional regulator n=1 Tax=Haloferax sp. DFSO52 TaxID=3388505 RepID=UPI003A897E38